MMQRKRKAMVLYDAGTTALAILLVIGLIVAFQTGEKKEKNATTKQEIQSFFDLSTPENTVRSYYEALFFDNKEKALKCLSNRIPESDREVIVFLNRAGIEQIIKEDPTTKKLFQDSATTKKFLEMYCYKREQIGKKSFYAWWAIPGIVSGEKDAFKVVKENSKWKIVGIKGEEDFYVSPEEQEKKAYEEIEKIVEIYEEAEKNPDFYGERLIVVGPPENAFKLKWNNEEKKTYITYYKDEEGKKKIDSSIYSYAFFDPLSPNLIGIDLYNDFPFPIETDYYEDRYYVRSYGGNIYQTEIDTEWDLYRKVINPQGTKRVWIKFPSSISKIDIKSIIIRLNQNEIVVGLQKIPR